MNARTHIVVCDRNLPLDKVPVEVCSGGVFDFRKPRALGSLQIDDAFVGFEKVNGEHQVILHRVDGRKTTIWGDSYYTAWQICTILVSALSDLESVYTRYQSPSA